MKFGFTIPIDVQLCKFDSEDQSIEEIIETIFLVEDDVTMCWNGFSISVSLKYDISNMWNDIEMMMDSLRRGVDEFSIHWPSSSFMARWNFKVKNELILITAFWTEIGVRDDVLIALRDTENQIITIPFDEYVDAWEDLQIFVVNCIEKAGYNLKELNL